MDLPRETQVNTRLTVITSPAEVDVTNAWQLAERLCSALNSGNVAVAVDLSKTGFIDCAGVSVLRAAAIHAASGGIELCLAAPCDQVRRMLHLLNADCALAVYPNLAAAFRAVTGIGKSSGSAAGAASQGAGHGCSADIIDLIMADHRRIRRLGGVLRDTGQESHGIGNSAWVLGEVWARLADLIDLHLGAEEEVCLPAFYGTDPSGREQRKNLIADHEDIRNAMQEASLQPAGSVTWWLAAGDALGACNEAFRREEQHTLPKFARHADDAQRCHLARQWQAYMAAPIRDASNDTSLWSYQRGGRLGRWRGRSDCN